MKLNEEQKLLVEKNRRLVHYLVKKMGKDIFSPEGEDWISTGTIGLVKAAVTFDESKKIKFATYAARCIQNEILMYLRKSKPSANIISLDETINTDWEGNEMKIADIYADKTDIEGEFEIKEIFIEVINIILNLLKPRECMIMLYRISEITQNVIAEKLKISQSYISRLEIRVKQKVKKYLSAETQFKEVFSMSISGNSYELSFATKDVENFNKIFSNLMKNPEISSNLPDFKMDYDEGKRVVIQFTREPEILWFIAEIIREIDEFSMSYVSEKEVIPKNNVILQDVKNDNAVETAKESKTKQVREYILSLDIFTKSEITKHFSNVSVYIINKQCFERC